MNAINPLARLAAVNAKADAEDQDRKNFRRFIADMRDYGQWSDEDVADYMGKIKVLMGKDDEAALDLFPGGLYQTADEAREGARVFWSSRIAA